MFRYIAVGFFIVMVSLGYHWYIAPKFTDAFTVSHDSSAEAGATG